MANLKVFLDGADKTSILEMVKNPKIHGFTTNPSLMRKSGVTDYQGFCKSLLGQVTEHPISFEVFEDSLEGMKKQAHQITKWGPNVYVKIPVINTLGQSTAPLIKELSHQGIKLNVTAIYSIGQIFEVVMALKGGAPSLVSVFAGRIADAGRDPLPILYAGAEICRDTDPNIELLWASTREAYNFVQAIQTGCHVITAPLDIIKKYWGFGKSLEDLTLETVKTFKTDATAAGFEL